MIRWIVGWTSGWKLAVSWWMECPARVRGVAVEPVLALAVQRL